MSRLEEAKRNLFDVLDDETSATNYQPIRDRVLVKPIAEPPGMTDSGIYVPKEGKQWRAVVMNIGPGTMTKKGRIPPDVEPGDIIVMGEWVGEYIELEREEFRLIRAQDILAVIVEEE